LLQRELTTDADLKAIVEKYAQDQKAFHDSFGAAFVKLSNLGQAEDELVNVENLLEIHPYKKFIDVYY
jgi:catalase (peroxidase I)